MYTAVLSKLWEVSDTYADLIEPMHEWINNLPGNQIAIEGYEEGVVDSVKSVSHSVIGGNLLATVLVNVRETGPIVEPPQEIYVE